jgi:integrase
VDHVAGHPYCRVETRRAHVLVSLPGPPLRFDGDGRTEHAHPPTMDQHNASIQRRLAEVEARSAGSRSPADRRARRQPEQVGHGDLRARRPPRASTKVRRQRSTTPAPPARGLSGVHLHTLRHSAASFLLAAGTHTKVVQEHLGHSSYAITADIYSHVGPAQQREAADRLDEALRW